MIGKFLGKIKDYGTSVTNAGNPQIYVALDFEHDGAQKTMTWYGSFVGGANDITMKTLINCGLAISSFGRMSEFNQGVASNLLDMNKVMELDIQEEPDYKDPTKMKAKVQWLNDPNAAPQIAKIDDALNAQFFGSGQVESDLMRIAGEMGLSNQAANTQNQNMNMGQNVNMGQNQNMNMGNGAQGAGQGQTQYTQNNIQNGSAQNASHSNNQNQNMNMGQNQNQNNIQQNLNNQAQNQNVNGQANNQNMGQQQNGGNFKAPF